jgi:uncharacterized protein YyaL (SSP411 family)
MANQLAHEPSPYLRQHADNPVAWMAWSDAAFAAARRRGVPVLVSIGYSTCHWCHVMAHESFEHQATAAVMNELYVCVKVDREEHPEVDEIYMDAVQALTGHGGWPLNAFVDHQGRPFYAATYVPRAQWVQLLRELARIWREEPARIAGVAAQIAGHLAQPAPAGGAALDDGVWKALGRQLERSFDSEHPGFAGNQQRAPKFPASQLIPLLLASGRPEWIEMAEDSLQAMQDAGIHDRVGGGFHRYSVDREWRLPHFEKMLYDNAQLIGAYARAGVQLARPDFVRTAVNTGDYLLRDLRLTSDGAFAGYAAAEDADDPAGEGGFYAWSPAQLAEVLGPEAGAALAKAWDISPGEPEVGPHGHVDPVISHIPHPRGARLPPDRAAALHRRASWEPLLPRLRAARDARPRPGRDDKVVTDLNGLALEGFAALGRWAEPGDRPRFIAAARELTALLMTRRGAHGLLRLAHRPAYITDYGHLVSGLTAAFDLLGDPALIDAAEAVADEAVARLRAEDGGFYTTPAGRTDLVRRSRETADNAYPAGQNALAVGLARLWSVTGRSRWREVAEGIVAAAAGMAREAPSAVATLLAAWMAMRRGRLTAVVAGAVDDPRTVELLTACRSSTTPGLAVVPISACTDRSWECLEGRRELSDPQVLVCTGMACLAPARTVAEVAERLAGVAAAV